MAIAMPSRLCGASGTSRATAASHRETNSDATEATSGRSPASTRRSIPRMKASATAR